MSAASQLALDLRDWPHEPRRSLWAVQVNEVSIYAVARVGSWWANWRNSGNEARICAEVQSLAGDRLHVHCEDRDHADWLVGFLTEHGVHRTALKVRQTDCGGSS